MLGTAETKGMKAYTRLMQASAGCHAGYDSQSLYEKGQEGKQGNAIVAP